ncbi:aldo/keto reductase [Streptomyces sp. NPDC006743]|uniref:aldo/keto reductase n=1 Tax=Streptomyces sp. NPDC006743 TaxID=3154480 RepID=UPI003453C864
MDTWRDRRLGGSDISTGALGLGCWAIGGPWQDRDGNPLGWGAVDDDESVAAVRRALDLGITFFDTADTYGAGHSERVLGRALRGRRSEAVIATKWGNVFDERTKTLTGSDDSPGHVRRALLASLERLGTDYVDLYQLHLSDTPPERALALRETCEDLVQEGLVRGYAWSTDDPRRAALFADGTNCLAVQHAANVLQDAPELFALCAARGLTSVNRSPLAMGLLAKAAGAGSGAGAGDIRAVPPAWLTWYGPGGVPAPDWARRVAAVREVLTSGGRTLAQGALAWLWARSPRTLPIPGFRSVAQVEENAGALEHGPLEENLMKEIQVLLGA